MMTSGSWKKYLAASSLRDALYLIGAIAIVLSEIGCGDVYRPVAQPISGPPPNPAAVHFVYAVNANGNDVQSAGSCLPSGSPPPCIADPGTFSRINVSGDSVANVVATGVFPIHAALTTDGTRFYVASSDGTISAGTATSNAQPTTINLPQLCANGCVPSPVFVHSTENSKMYVADPANGTVSVINTTSNIVVQTIAVDPVFAGNPLPSPDPNSRPVALAELPNGAKIYSANRGTHNVSSINTIDGTIASPPINISTGSPLWIAAGADNVHVYVLDTSGTISVISSLSDTVTTHSASAGAGANFMQYDRHANFLYVTNPGSSSLSIFDVSSDPPVLRGGAPIAIGAAAGSNCTSAVHPTSVTVLADGSRAYVAAYQADASGAVCTQVSVIDPGTWLVTKSIPLSQSQSAPQSECSTVPFRVFAAASAGATGDPVKVYVSQCDAGSVAVIDTFALSTGPDPHGADVVMANLASPVSAFPSSQISISGVTTTPATSTSPATATYTYSFVSGTPPQSGTIAYIAGMSDAANNGTFSVNAATPTALTVISPSGVSASNQNGTGQVVPTQNPVFLVAGP
jgi:DNA-binding beta-propeller fold protein YncE